MILMFAIAADDNQQAVNNLGRKMPPATQALQMCEIYIALEKRTARFRHFAPDPSRKAGC